MSTLSCLLSAVYCQMSTLSCLLSAVYSQLSTLSCLLSTVIVYCELSTASFLVSVVFFPIHNFFFFYRLVDQFTFYCQLLILAVSWQLSALRYLLSTFSYLLRATNYSLEGFCTKPNHCQMSKTIFVFQSTLENDLLFVQWHNLVISNSVKEKRLVPHSLKIFF